MLDQCIPWDVELEFVLAIREIITENQRINMFKVFWNDLSLFSE
jgi:hypothetical protein